MLHNDFFLRCLSFEDGQAPSSLTLTCLAGGRPCLQIRYEGDELTRRLAYGREELARYRDSSLPRILGLSRRPETAFLHEHFSFFASETADTLHILAEGGGGTVEKAVSIVPYRSPNRYRFPLRGTVLVTDTYPSINSHRWCRNSEFAFDAGLFDESLTRSLIQGAPVLAACSGVVEEVFDGLDNTGEKTDLDELERRFGEHARIDGNHVLIRHGGGELSLYAHLSKGSVTVRQGQSVAAGQEIGRVGSSGSSWLPHLHFHVMRDGIEGPGVPVRFANLKTILGEPCSLEDTVNLVRADDPSAADCWRRHLP